MKKIIKTIIKHAMPQSEYWRLKSLYIEKYESQWYPIINNIEEAFPIESQIKEDTWETVHFPELYQLSKSFDLSCYHPAKYISRIGNARVSNNSDIVITPIGVVWDKYYDQIFCKTSAWDVNLIKCKEGQICVANSRKCIEIEGPAISMLGALAHIWAHFIMQFLPKLYFAEEAGLLDGEITLLIPEYSDEHVRQCVSMVLERHPKVRVIECLDDRCEYKCQLLYYIPSMSTAANGGPYLMPYDCVIPQCVKDILKIKLVNPLQKKTETVSKSWGSKLYMVRRSAYRTVMNVDDVENYFISKGFELVEPHKCTLEEKVAMFRNAKIIAGPCSASWSNTIFCTGAKGFMMYPFSRALDTYPHYLADIGNVDTTMVIGVDIFREQTQIKFNSSIERLDAISAIMQPDYYIPIDRIDAMYKQFIEENGDE